MKKTPLRGNRAKCVVAVSRTPDGDNPATLFDPLVSLSRAATCTRAPRVCDRTRNPVHKYKFNKTAINVQLPRRDTMVICVYTVSLVRSIEKRKNLRNDVRVRFPDHSVLCTPASWIGPISGGFETLFSRDKRVWNVTASYSIRYAKRKFAQGFSLCLLTFKAHVGRGNRNNVVSRYDTSSFTSNNYESTRQAFLAFDRIETWWTFGFRDVKRIVYCCCDSVCEPIL